MQAGSAAEGSHVDNARRAAAAVLLHAQGPHRLSDKGKHCSCTSPELLSCRLSNLSILVSLWTQLDARQCGIYCWLVLQMDRECPLVLDMHVAPAKPALQPTSSRERRAQPASSPKGSEKTGDSLYPAGHCCNPCLYNWTPIISQGRAHHRQSRCNSGCHPLT